MFDKFNKTEDSILKGLLEALAYAKGSETTAKIHKVKVPKIDVVCVPL